MGVRKVAITNKNYANIAKSLSLIKFAASVGAIEHIQYLDVDFKNPVIHNKLKQSAENLAYVINEINRKYLDGNNKEDVEDVSFKIHELMRNVMRLDINSLDELSKMVELKIKLTK